MRRETKLKKALGFGKTVELPAPIYLQAALMGLVDETAKGYYYVLPAGERDKGPNYVRCAHVDPNIHNYVPTPLNPWNEHEREGRRVSIQGGAERVLVFLRGLYRSSAPDSEYDAATRLMALYLEQLVEQIAAARDWNLDLEEFVLNQRHQPARDWMSEPLCSNMFDIMIARHKRYKTE
jgi:hypothetical protein